jgi:peroxiredoxin
MQGAAMSAPLSVGSAAPEFALPDCSGRPIALSAHRGQPVVVFYPLDWGPGCSQQLDLYQQEWEELQRRGAALLAISVDSIDSHGAWAAVRGLTFPLLADFQPKGEVAHRDSIYREADGFSERALYVVNEEGIIRYSHVSPFLHHVPDVYVLFDVLDESTSRQAA